MGNSMGGSASKQREKNRTSFGQRMTNGILAIDETIFEMEKAISYSLHLLLDDHTLEDWEGLPPFKIVDKEKIEKTLEELRNSKTGERKKEIVLSNGEKVIVSL